MALAAGALLCAAAAPAMAQQQQQQHQQRERDNEAAAATTARRAIASPRSACLDAVRAAERAHGIPDGLLVAMALNESGLHAYALNIGGRAHFPSNREDARRLYWNAIGRTAVMAGCVQVNAGVHARRDDWPLDPVAAADWAARHLRAQYERTGDWTRALIRWHGGSPASSARIVCRVRSKMEVTAPGQVVLRAGHCGGEVRAARLRRNGSALLELAEDSAR